MRANIADFIGISSKTRKKLAVFHKIVTNLSYINIMKIRDLLESLTVTSNAPELIDLPYTMGDKGRIFKFSDVLESEKQVAVEMQAIYEEAEIFKRLLLGKCTEEEERELEFHVNRFSAFGKIYELMDRDIKSFNATEKLELQDALSKLTEFFTQRSNESQDLAESKIHPKDIDKAAENYSAHFMQFMKNAGKIHAETFGSDPAIPDEQVKDLEKRSYVQGLKHAHTDRADNSESASAYDQMISHLSTVAERVGISIMSRFERE